MSNKLPLQVIQQVGRAADIVRQGGIIAFPTDTVYGLGADIFNREAVERVYQIKQRPHNLAFPVLLADMSQIPIVASSVSDIAQFLMNRFWPGGLTLVLPRAASLPDIVTAGNSNVAVRIPEHAVPVAIIQISGTPIIGTSANVSGKPSALTAQEIEQQLGSEIGLIIDGGKCPGGIESTIVDVTGHVPVILRQGAIPEDEIKQAYQEYNNKEVSENAYCSGL